MAKTIALLFLVFPASALADVSPERKIEVLLSAHHDLPSKAELERAVPDAKDLLMMMAEREELFPYYRHRAIEALAMWSTDDVRLLYRRLLASERASIGVKTRVLLRVPRVFGDRAQAVLEPFEVSEHPILRRAARVSLRKR